MEDGSPSEMIYERPEINPRNVDCLEAFDSVVVNKVLEHKIVELNQQFPFDSTTIKPRPKPKNVPTD